MMLTQGKQHCPKNDILGLSVEGKHLILNESIGISEFLL